MVELFTEVDENNNVIGLRPIKDFQSGKYIHRSAHLLLFNSKGEVLIHKRSPNKIWSPNLYTFSVAGTVGDESYEDCIKHEIPEELGIKIPVKLLFIYKFFIPKDKSFHALFIGKSDKKIKPDPDEISEIKWVSLKWLRKDISDNPEEYTLPFLAGMKKYFEKFKNLYLI